MATFAVSYTPSGSVTAANLAATRLDQASNGLVRGTGGGTPALVSADSVDRVLTVQPADWFFNGYWASATGSGTVTIAANASGNPRIDVVVAQIDTTTTPTASYAIVQGTPAGSPTVPALNTNGAIWQLALCQVAVANGAVALVPGNLTDLRPVHASGGFYSTPTLHAAEHLLIGSDPIGFMGELAWPELQALGPVLSGQSEQQALQDIGKLTIPSLSTYTVPAGFNLYITSLTASSAGIYQVTGGASGTQDVFTFNIAGTVSFPSPLILGPGMTFGNRTGTPSTFLRGVLIKQTRAIPVTAFALAVSSGTTYTVPAGSWFVLTNVFSPFAGAASATLAIDGVVYNMPGFGTGLNYLTVSGPSSSFGCSLLDSSGYVVVGPARPLLLPPGAALTNPGASLATNISGYLWSQAG